MINYQFDTPNYDFILRIDILLPSRFRRTWLKDIKNQLMSCKLSRDGIEAHHLM